MFTAASFFSGVGAMDYAAYAGFGGNLDIRHLCEINPYRREVLKKHRWLAPNAVIYHDIQQVTAKDIGYVDIIYGGFPCQDISYAGNGEGLSGAKSGLFFDLWRLIGEIRPRCIVLENVPAIAVRGGTTITAAIATSGYDGVWLPVSAVDFGSPQYRERWLFVGYTNRIGLESAECGQVCNSVIGTHCSTQSVPISDANQSACQSSRNSAWQVHRGFRAKSRMGRNANGAAPWLDIVNHKFPSGSWLPQSQYEPDRLTPPGTDWKNRIQALGDTVTPQQLLPVFAAVYEWLESAGD